MQIGEWLEGVDIKRRKLNLASKSQITHTYFYI